METPLLKKRQLTRPNDKPSKKPKNNTTSKRYRELKQLLLKIIEKTEKLQDMLDNGTSQVMLNIG